MAASQKWVVLERTDYPSDLNYRVAFYANVPAARQRFYADASAASQWLDLPPGDLTQLQSGAVAERTERINYRTGTTNAAIRDDLDAKQAAYQAEVDAHNKWDRYGTRRNADGSMTNTGVA